jgi:amino acid transporter
MFGAIIAYCGGFSYAEWGLMIPESGGDTPYLEYVFKKPKQLASFMYCWCRIFLAHTSITSALCIVCINFIFMAFPVSTAFGESAQFSWIKKGLSLVILVFIWSLLAFSNSVATRTNSYLTVGKILLCGFMVISGFMFAFGAFSKPPRPLVKVFTFSGSSTNPANYASALCQVFFCYEGWAYLGSAMGELQNPTRNAPRAIVGGVTIVALIYVFTNMSYFLVLTPQEIIDAKTTLGSAYTRALYGELFGTTIMSLLIMISAFGSGLATSFAASRVVLEAAKRGFVPYSSLFARSHPKYGTPFNAITFHCLISSVLIVAPPSGNAFNFLVELCMYGIWIFYTITMIGLLLLRKVEPAKDRPFRVYLICPIVIILTGIFLIIFPFMSAQGALTSGVGLIVLALGVPTWYFSIYKRQASL